MNILIPKDTCTPGFTAALFTIVKTWKQPKWPSRCGTMKYYSMIKKNEIMPFTAIWMDLENIIGEGNGTPLQYSCLETPMDGGAW